MKKLWLNENKYVLFNEIKTNLVNEIVTRKRAFDFYSMLPMLPDPDPVLRREGKDVRVYKELLSDPHVWACVQSRKSGVLSLEWEIDRGKDKTQQAQIIEDFFKSIDIYTLIAEILNATLFGFQPLEVIWQKTGEMVLPSEIKAKPPDWFCFDDDNKLKFRTKQNYFGEDLPDKKFLCPQYNPTYENPYGERTLSRVFWSVSFKNGGLKFWARFTEKYGIPFLIGKHPRGNASGETEDLADLLDNMIQDAIAVIPDDSSIELMQMEKASSSVDVFEKLIDKTNNEISKAILGQTLTTEIGNKGSYAASSTHMDVRQDIVDADKKIVERTLNQLIQWIYQINFSAVFTKDIPTFEMYEEEDVDLTLSQRDQTLTEAGIKFTKQYFMRMYGFDEEDIEVPEAGVPTHSSKIQSPQPVINNLQPKFKGFKSDAVVKKAEAELGFAGGFCNSFFKETKPEFQDQQTVDDFIGSFSEKELQKQAEVILNPIIDLINKSSSYEEIQEKLSAKGFNTNQIEKILQKAIFISEVWGRLSTNFEDTK